MAVKIDIDVDVIKTFLVNILDLNKKITTTVEIRSKLVQKKIKLVNFIFPKK